MIQTEDGTNPGGPDPDRPDPGGRPSLDGFLVLEVGIFMAGPFAGMQLADLGADVVKVEAPGGDPVRRIGPFLDPRGEGLTPDGEGPHPVGEPPDGESSPFVRLNRNKRSSVIDLKHPDGRAAFGRLAATADVVLENLRPGAMRRMGLGYDDLRRRNPGLVYVSLSGWGQDGPLAGLAGLDVMAQARSGLMSITGAPDGEPAKAGVPVCDLVSGLYAALATVAALRSRDRDGEGQFIDVSLFESGVSLGIWEAGGYFATGEVRGPLGSAHQSTAPYRAFRTGDGWVTIGAVTDRTWRAFCQVLGLHDLPAEERYGSAYQRNALRAELEPVIEAATRRWSRAELLTALADAGVPCAPIEDYAAVFNDEHLAEREFFWDAPHPRLGGVRQIGSPMRLSATPAVRGRAGPSLGADTGDVLRAAGYSEGEIARLIRVGAIA